MINTKDIPESEAGLPKTISPSNVTAKINSVALEKVPYIEGGLNFILNIETEPIEDFEGFLIDKDNPDLGRYAGQIGKLKTSQYAYANSTTRSGIVVNRDANILKMLGKLCSELDCREWLDSQDNKHDTIESLIEAFNLDKPFKDKWLYMCVAAKEYKNKAGYMNYELYFPKLSRGEDAFCNASNSTNKVLVYDEAKHLRKYVEPASVTNFEPQSDFSSGMPTSSGVSSDFEL